LAWRLRDFATNHHEYRADDVNLNQGTIRHGPGAAARRETGRDHFPHHVGFGHDTGHFSSLKHEKRADSLLPIVCIAITVRVVRRLSTVLGRHGLVDFEEGMIT